MKLTHKDVLSCPSDASHLVCPPVSLRILVYTISSIVLGSDTYFIPKKATNSFCHGILPDHMAASSDLRFICCLLNMIMVTEL